VVKLARAPGAREQRWAHLLCGPVDETAPAGSQRCQRVGTSSALLERVSQLERSGATAQHRAAAVRPSWACHHPDKLRNAPQAVARTLTVLIMLRRACACRTLDPKISLENP
jgi:hypothetical protein